jgi:hypothetical protein
MTFTPLADWGVVPQNPHYDTSGVWALYVRDDSNGEILGELQDYTKATFISRFNDVGTWEIESHLSEIALELIRRRKVGIVARVGESTVLSGPMTRVQRTWDRDGERLVITGYSDLWWAASRIVATPNVETIDFEGSFDFVLRNVMWQGMQRSGPYILGVEGATPGPQPFPCGVSVRWERCLTVMQAAARQSVPIYGFDIRDLTFESWLPGDHGTIFSLELGTMGSYELVAESPDANWLAVLGRREGAERQWRYVADAENVAEWWGYEDVLDASSAGEEPERGTDEDGNEWENPWPDNQEELQLAGEEGLAEKIKPVSCRVTPIDIPTQRFGLHYGLGDLATVYFADGLEFTETISEVTIGLDTNKALSVVPTVGAPQMNLETFRRLESAERRIRRLEMGR